MMNHPAALASQWYENHHQPQLHAWTQNILFWTAAATVTAAAYWNTCEDDDYQTTTFSWNQSKTVECCGIAGVVSDPKKKYDARYVIQIKERKLK